VFVKQPPDENFVGVALQVSLAFVSIIKMNTRPAGKLALHFGYKNKIKVISFLLTKHKLKLVDFNFQSEIEESKFKSSIESLVVCLFVYNVALCFRVFQSKINGRD